MVFISHHPKCYPVSTFLSAHYLAITTSLLVHNLKICPNQLLKIPVPVQDPVNVSRGKIKAKRATFVVFCRVLSCRLSRIKSFKLRNLLYINRLVTI